MVGVTVDLDDEGQALMYKDEVRLKAIVVLADPHKYGKGRDG